MRQNSTTRIVGIGATNATQVTAAVDTLGFSYARIICISNTTAGLSTTLTNNALEESDDGTNYTAISAAAPGTAYTPTSATIATTLAKLSYNVDLRGRKRYLKVTFSTAVTTAPMIVADLGLPADGKSTAAEIGAAFSADL